MNINKLKLLLSAIVCITDIYADIDINLQNTSSQQVVDEENLSTIEPTSNGNNNLFDNNSNVSLENILDALTQNPNDVSNNETNVNNDVSSLDNGFIQFDAETSDTSQYVQQQAFDADACHELALNFTPGHTYNETKDSSSAGSSEKHLNSSGKHPN